MSTEREAPSPRRRRFEVRRRQLLDLTVSIAEDEGWEAVTTRRLAGDLGYSQPVIYSHFSSRDDLITAVVRDGFQRLTSLIEHVSAETDPAVVQEQLARTYVDFGREHPRLYEAMFRTALPVPFAQTDTPAELREAFAALTRAVASQHSATDAARVSELFWACCHGLTTLLVAQRIPPDRLTSHIEDIAALTRSQRRRRADTEGDR